MAGAPAGPDRRLVGSTWATWKLPWLRVATSFPSAIRPVGVVVNGRQGVGARLEGNGIRFPVRIGGVDRCAPARHVPRRAGRRRSGVGASRETGMEQGSGSSSERPPVCQDLLASSAHSLWHCAQKMEGSTPRDGAGFASVREKRRSRHASRPLLWLLRVAMRTVHVLFEVCHASLPLSGFCRTVERLRPIIARLHSHCELSWKTISRPSLTCWALCRRDARGKTGAHVSKS